MVQHAVKLRDARPTIEEGLLFARYLNTAAEGFFRLMLGRQFDTIVARAFVKPNNDYSYENVLVAERDNTIVGMASAYSAKQHRQFIKHPLSTIADCRSLRMMVVMVLFAPMLRIIDNMADEDYYLQAIATDPACRGQGIGSILIDAIEANAVANGCSRLALDVSGKNDGARRLYERRGMSVESRWPKRFAIPALVFYRMVKRLPT